MKKYLLLLLLLTMTSVFNLLAYEFTSNDLMYVIAFSDDYIAFESIMDSGTVGGPNRSSIILVNIATGEAEEDFIVSVNPDLDREYEEYNEAEISELNSSLRKDAYSFLEDLDFDFDIIKTELPGGLSVSYKDTYFNPEQDPDACLLMFSVVHEATGKSWSITDRVEMQRGLKSDMTTDSMPGFPYTQITGIFTSSSQTDFVILYNTPFLNMYEQGNIGGMVLDHEDISHYLNEIGLESYYKDKDAEALTFDYNDPSELLTDWLNIANLGKHIDSIQYFEENPIEKDGISFDEYSSWINSKITRNKTIKSFDFISEEYLDEDNVRFDLTIKYEDKTEITKWVIITKNPKSWMLTTKGSLF